MNWLSVQFLWEHGLGRRLIRSFAKIKSKWKWAGHTTGIIRDLKKIEKNEKAINIRLFGRGKRSYECQTLCPTLTGSAHLCCDT